MLGLGQTLGNYRIVRQLGSGGMGVVYEAEHPLIGKRVALKVIHKELAQNHEVVARFFNEARAANSVGNEHVVDVSDFGQTPDGEYFLVMEMLDGKNLADLLERGKRLEVPRALHVAAQIADGLAAAHAVGVVHRDLKPDNVFLVDKLGDPDFVKIVDFGLAKLMATAPGAKITKQGVILGTPEYMSPEQAESKVTVDHRTDVWSLGILVYQMTTGLLPFVGASMGEVLVKVVSRAAAPPRGVNPAIPPAVEQIVLRCLRKRPEERFQGMAELRAALLDPDGYLAAVSDGSIPPEATVTGPGLPPAPRVSGPVASPTAKTLIGTGVPAPVAAAASGPLPKLRAPTPAVNATRVLDPDTAAGRPARVRRGRRGWAIVAAGAAIGLLAALAVSRCEGEPASTAASASDAAAAAPAPGPAPAPASPDAAADVVPRSTTVHIVITTEPPGAEIFDAASGERLGVSPGEIRLPRDGLEHELLFRHPGCGEKRKLVRADADAELVIMLEPLADKPREKGAKPKSPPPPSPSPDPPPGDLLAPKF